MLKHRNNTISYRIKKALLGLTLGLSILFTGLIFLLVYIVEDQIFVNLLRTENQHFQQIDVQQSTHWQPQNRSMQLITERKDLPQSLQNLKYTKPGVYEYFDAPQAYFVLFDYRKAPVTNEQKPYYITYDVSALLSVRSGRVELITIVIVVSAMIMIIAVFVAFRLSKKILQPLKALTDQLQDHDHINVAKGFSQPFAGDEIGTLAEQLEQALQNVQRSAQKAFEFNRGVSHELRSPIQIAINATELLTIQHQELDQSATMDRLKRSVNQMEKICQAFLWLVSDRTFEQQKTHVHDLVWQLKSHYQTYLTSNIIIKQTEDELYYWVPMPVLSVIIESLINNAIQHGNQDDILIEITDHMLTVKNNNKVNNNPSQQGNKVSEGYGIGLIIVKRLCQKLNWHLNIDDHKSSHYCVKISAIESSRKLS